MPKPNLLCGANHYIKVMTNSFFALTALSNWLSVYNKVDSLRVKRIIWWYVRGYMSSNKTLTFQQFVTNTRAYVAHHVNDHQYYDQSWYWTYDLDEL